VLLSELLPDLKDGFLHVWGEIPLVCQQVVVFDQAAETLWRKVNVLDSFVDSILANVLWRKHEAVRVGNLKRQSVVDEVHLLQVVLLEIPHESGKQVSLRHRQGRVFVVASELLHQKRWKVLVADIQNKVWSALVYSLWQVLVDHVVIDLVSIPREVLIDKVEWVPLMIHIFVQCLWLPVRVECLVQHVIHVNFKSVVESLLFHPFT
jgi:hypothetical protein